MHDLEPGRDAGRLRGGPQSACLAWLGFPWGAPRTSAKRVATMFAPIEGDRLFDITYGLITGFVCLGLAVPLLWWTRPGHQRSFFGSAIDPAGRLQLAYGIFCIAMGFTDIGCRLIPHGELLYVHPTFALLTLALALGLGPRLILLGLRATPATETATAPATRQPSERAARSS